MSNNTQIQGAHNIVIQNVTDSTLTLNVNGEVREIQNQLAELKALLQKHQAQKVQYAEKIYNIEHIDEANFGFLTGKKPFNEQLTLALLQAIQPGCMPAQRFLEKVAHIPGAYGANLYSVSLICKNGLNKIFANEFMEDAVIIPGDNPGERDDLDYKGLVEDYKKNSIVLFSTNRKFLEAFCLKMSEFMEICRKLDSTQ